MANMHCRSELNLEKLCAKCAKIDCAKVEKVISDNICSQLIWAKDLKAENEVVNNLCVPGAIKTNELSADMIGGNSICVRNGTINNLCVDNLSVGNFLPYIPYRATTNYAANVVYTLGTDLNFDNIVDDPNGNVSVVPFMTYTAPIAGYYDLTLNMGVTNLISFSGPILGIPLANAEIYVNGLLVREVFAPYLSFLNAQKMVVSSLITLQAGDVVSLKYNVLGEAGVAIAGTVNIAGNGLEGGNSLFKIILESALSSSTIVCEQCPLVEIPCSPVTTPCQPLVTPPVEHDPCEPCEPCESTGMCQR